MTTGIFSVVNLHKRGDALPTKFKTKIFILKRRQKNLKKNVSLQPAHTNLSKITFFTGNRKRAKFLRVYKTL